MTAVGNVSVTARQGVYCGGQTADAGIAAGTKYMRLDGVPTATETEAFRWVAPGNGTIDRLVTETKQGATGTTAFTVRKNGVATTLLIAATVGVAAIQTLSDTTHSFSVATGDVITVEVVIATVASSVKTCCFRYTSA